MVWATAVKRRLRRPLSEDEASLWLVRRLPKIERGLSGLFVAGLSDGADTAQAMAAHAARHQQEAVFGKAASYFFRHAHPAQGLVAVEGLRRATAPAAAWAKMRPSDWLEAAWHGGAETDDAAMAGVIDALWDLIESLPTKVRGAQASRGAARLVLARMAPSVGRGTNENPGRVAASVGRDALNAAADRIALRVGPLGLKAAEWDSAIKMILDHPDSLQVMPVVSAWLERFFDALAQVPLRRRRVMGERVVGRIAEPLLSMLGAEIAAGQGRAGLAVGDGGATLTDAGEPGDPGELGWAGVPSWA